MFSFHLFRQLLPVVNFCPFLSFIALFLPPFCNLPSLSSSSGSSHYQYSLALSVSLLISYCSTPCYLTLFCTQILPLPFAVSSPRELKFLYCPSFLVAYVGLCPLNITFFKSFHLSLTVLLPSFQFSNSAQPSSESFRFVFAYPTLGPPFNIS